MNLDSGERTAAVLLDLGAQRSKEAREIADKGLSVESMQDGLLPERRDEAQAALIAAMMVPTWANAVMAATLVAATSQNERLRDALVRLASMIVAWIEHLDQRKENANG